MINTRILLCISIVFNLSLVSGNLRCYTCSVTQDDVDQRCITDPDKVETGSAITNCDKQYCISLRQEYKDPIGKVASMSRDCVDKPLHMNEILEDSTFRHYYVACKTPLCNGGSGKDITGGTLVADVGAVGNLLVPGIGYGKGSATTASCSVVAMCISYLALIYFR